MARLAFISDVHGDVGALRDALAQIAALRCDRVVCCGDLVDYGPSPEETVALVRDRGIATIRGNHDRWALREKAAPGGSQLSADALAYLAALPTGLDLVVEGVRIAVRHATPGSDMVGVYGEQAQLGDVRRWLGEAGADVLVVGHTHVPMVLRALGGGMIVNPGALYRGTVGDGAWLLDPSTGKFVRAPAPGGGSFGILELPERRFRVLRASDGAEVPVPETTVGVRRRPD